MLTYITYDHREQAVKFGTQLQNGFTLRKFGLGKLKYCDGVQRLHNSQRINSERLLQ